MSEKRKPARKPPAKKQAEQKEGGTIVDATLPEPGDLEPTDVGSGDHYCPGCGRRSNGKGTCTGSAEGPHPAIQTAPVSELEKDPAKHTPAPPSE